MTDNFYPLVSVIIPTYNRRDMIPIAIESVLKQTYKNLECIVVADGGEDISDIIKSFRDYRLRYHYKQINTGLGATRNIGLSMMKGEYVCFLDDDDLYYPLHIEILVDQMLKNYENNTKLVYSNAVQAIYEKSIEVDQCILRVKQIPYDMEYNHDNLLLQNIMPVLTFMVETKLIIENKIKFVENRLPFEDWRFLIELSQLTNFHHIKLATCEYTYIINGNSMSNTMDFSTPLVEIFKNNFNYVPDERKVWFAKNVNAILESRGIPPLFNIKTA